MLISLAAEKVTTIFTFNITNSVLGTLLVDGLIIILAISVNVVGVKKIPGAVQNFVEIITEAFLDFCDSIAHSKSRVFFPIIFTLFLFIIVSNWLALLPGFSSILIKEAGRSFPIFRSPSADLNTTLALGIFSITAVQYFGFRYLGLSYLSKYINVKGPIDFMVGLLELVLELAKVASFGFRLFGNIFAGEVLLIVAGTLIPLFSPIPVLGMELFVGFIQALVFAILTLVFLSMSVEKAH
jgi:F-type H+-transporting ATPase subunit a